MWTVTYRIYIDEDWNEVVLNTGCVEINKNDILDIKFKNNVYMAKLKKVYNKFLCFKLDSFRWETVMEGQDFVNVLLTNDTRYYITREDFDKIMEEDNGI